MAVEVKISGVTYVAVTDSVQITEQARATASTTIQVRLDALPIPVSLQAVEILIDDVAVFAGHIENVGSPQYDTGFETRVVSLSIQSLEAILNRRLITRNWYNKYVHEIVQDIYTEYLAEEGLTLGSISVTTVQLDSYKKSYEQASSVLNDLAKRCDGASFYIGPDKKFYFLISEDFPQVDAPEHITGLKRVDAYGDLRTVQVMKGASSRIVGTATNATLLAEIAALSGTSGKIEKMESDGTIHNPTKAGTEATERLAQYAEREITLTCTCHDLVKTALYQTWAIYSGHFPTARQLPTGAALPGAASVYPLDMTGLYTVVQRTITCYGPDQYKVSVTLKNRNFFARYGYSVREALEDARNANRKTDDINSEDQFTPDKKIAARDAWNIIASEKDHLDSQADIYGVTTEKISYDAAFATLADYLNAGAAWISGYPSWISDDLLSETTDIVGADYQATWRAYYDARIVLNAALSEAIEAAVNAGVPGLVPRFRGSFLFVDISTAYYSGPIVNDWIVLYSLTAANCGIYKWSGSVWIRQSSPTEEIQTSCALAVLAAVDAGYCASTDYFEVSSQALELIIVKRLLAKQVVLLAEGYLKSHDYSTDTDGFPLAGFMLDVAGQMIDSYGSRFVNALIKNAVITNASISGIITSGALDTQEEILKTWTASGNFTGAAIASYFELTPENDYTCLPSTFCGKTPVGIKSHYTGIRDPARVYEIIVTFSDTSTAEFYFGLSYAASTYSGSIQIGQYALAVMNCYAGSYLYASKACAAAANSTSATKRIEYTSGRKGSVNIKLIAAAAGAGVNDFSAYTLYARIYKDGAAYGTQRSLSVPAYVYDAEDGSGSGGAASGSWTEDVTGLTAGSKIQIYLWVSAVRSGATQAAQMDIRISTEGFTDL